MTKLRPPLSIEDAITRIAGALGWTPAAQVLGVSERTLRYYSEPDTPHRLTLADAVKLDIAYRAAGGDGAPLFETYAMQLELAARNAVADKDELHRRSEIAAKEVGEAVAALMKALNPHASKADLVLAVREVSEGMDALKDTLPLLVDGAGLSGGGSCAVPRGDR